MGVSGLIRKRRNMKPGLSGKSAMIGKPGHSKPFMSLSMSQVVTQSTAAAQNPRIQTGKISRGHNQGLQWDGIGDINPLLASERDCFIGASILPSSSISPDPNPSEIVPPTLVPLTKTHLLLSHPLRDSVLLYIQPGLVSTAS